MSNEEQRQAWRDEWGELTDGSSYETWLEDRLLDMQSLKLKSLHVEDGKIDMVCQGDLVSIFAGCMAEMLDGEGAINLVEYKVSHPVKGPLVLTLQRQFGKTPMDLVRESRDEIEKLRLHDAYLSAKAAYYEHDAGCHGGCVECDIFWKALVKAKSELKT